MAGDEHSISRRGLLRHLAERAASSAKELGTARRVLREAVREDPVPYVPEPEPPPEPPPPPQLPSATLTLDEVLDLAREHGLDARLDDVRRLCRPSARLAPTGSERRSHAGGVVPPDGVKIPYCEGAPLPLVSKIDMEEAAATVDLGPLPTTGTLWIFCDLDTARERGRRGAAGACRLVFEEVVRLPDGEAEALAIAGELMLPRVWAEPVADLQLDADEQLAWEELRRSLAESQGVEPFDEAPDRPIHRILGWPDERGGWMPLACAMLAAGLEVPDAGPPAHPPTTDLAVESARWRLLFQLTVGARERLYVWADDRALENGDFSAIQAFLH